MLSTLTRKLCPFMSLAMMTIGCGKKITDGDTKPGSSIQNSEVPSSFTIKFQGAQGRTKQYRVEKNSRFFVPEKLKVTSGTTAGKTVKISYDVNEFDSDFYEFSCTYVPSTNPQEMKISGCWDLEGGSFGDVTENDQEFALYQGDIIEVKVQGNPISDFAIEAYYKTNR